MGHLPVCPRLICGVVAAALASVALICAAPAQAAPRDQMRAAFERSEAYAKRKGVDIIAQVRSQGPKTEYLPANARVRIHWSVSPGMDMARGFYISVRDINTGALVGGQGKNAKQGFWATFGEMQDGTTLAASRGISPTTVMTNITAVAPKSLPFNAARTMSGDGLRSADDLWFVVPVHAKNSWTEIMAVPGAGGQVTYSGSLPGYVDETRDECTYPAVAIVVKSGLIRSSRWTAQCGETRIETVTTVNYREYRKEAPRPRLTQSQVLTTPVPGSDPLWGEVASATAATLADRRITAQSIRPTGVVAYPVGNRLYPITKQLFMGNTSRVLASSPERYPVPAGARAYTILPAPGQTTLTEAPYTAIVMHVGPGNLITRMWVEDGVDTQQVAFTR